MKMKRVVKIMNSTIFKQLDSRWSDKPYPTKKSSFGGNGCGCCACVHVAIEQESKKNWTPESLRPWMVKQGFAVAGQGTTWSGIEATLKYLGHKSVVWIKKNDPMSKAWAELNKGNRIGVLLVNNCKTPDGTYWTASGHYVAFTDYYVKDGKHYFYIKDSGGRNHDGIFCYEKSIKGALPQLWIVERIGEAPTPTPAPPTPTPKKGKYTGKYPTFKKYLEKGDKGSSVTLWQKYLNWSFGGQEGFTKLVEDGLFGSATHKWTCIWQEAAMGKGQGDGKVGCKTVARAKELGGYSPTPRVIDVSAFQDAIDWGKVRAAGIAGAIVKCGYRGAGDAKLKEDKMFLNHIKGAYNAGIPVGIYMFTEAVNAEEGKAEAAYALNQMQKAGVPLSFPIAVDTEDVFWEEKDKSGKKKKCKGRANSGVLSKAKRTEAVKAFCEEIIRQGYKPMIYASLSWLNNQLDMSKLPYDVWVAQYNNSCDYKGKYILWQYTSDGSVNGVKGDVDISYSYMK